MCNKKQFRYCPSEIDPCLREAISTLNARGFETVACCCGHNGKYPLTIIYKGKSGGFFELFSGVQIPREKRFYKRDEDGYYYIPEINQSKQKICECGHKQWGEHKVTFEPMVAQECNVKGCKCKKFKLRKQDLKHPMAWKFRRAYANIPLNARKEICCVVDDEPMSFSVVKIEIDNETKKGYQAIEILLKMGVI